MPGDDAIQDAAGKAAKEGKELAKDAAAIGKLMGTGGADVSAWIHLLKRWGGRILKLVFALGLVFLQLLAAGATANAQCGIPPVSDSEDPAYVQTGNNPGAGETGGARGPGGEDMAIVKLAYEMVKERYGALPDGNKVLLATFEAALAESNFKNLNYGDRDSLGVFQQRAGWGNATERRTPSYAIDKFLDKLETVRKSHPEYKPHQLAQQTQISWCTKNAPNNSDCHGTWGGNYLDEEKRARNLIEGQGGFFPAGGDPNAASTNNAVPGSDSVQAVDASACPGVGPEGVGAVKDYKVISNGIEYTFDLPGGQRGATILAAFTQLGVPYGYGQNNWKEEGDALADSRLDCSALTLGAVKRGANITLPHKASEQYPKMKTKHTSMAKMKAGDFLFWSHGGTGGIYHVGIYLGEGSFNGGGKVPLMVAAPSSDDVVKVQTIWGSPQYFGDPGYKDEAVLVSDGTYGPPVEKKTYDRILPFGGGHKGVDIMSKTGDPIYAITDGVVRRSGCQSAFNCRSVDKKNPTLPSDGAGCGFRVSIYHPKENTYSLYCHMVREPLVKTGDKVVKGQVIGYVGSTGDSGVEHLHFQTHTGASKNSDGTPQNPKTFMAQRGVKL